MKPIVNTSILQTMTRSLNTLATVVITLVALLALGGVSLQNFAFALLVGICSGGYHSIFYSAPLVVRFRAMQQRREARAIAAQQGQADALTGRDRNEILTARRERRERGKVSRVSGPVRYKRRRDVYSTDEVSAEYLDPLDAQNAGLHDEELELGHEEIVLNLEDDVAEHEHGATP